jgi:hypothetical protein
MCYQEIPTLFIARPLVEALDVRPFSGRVLGRFKKACNLVDEQRHIITLTLPEIGNGPFSIVVENQPGLFQSLQVDQPAYADAHYLLIGERQLTLRTATVWEPRLACSEQTLELGQALTEMLRPYAQWSPFPGTTPVTQGANRLAGEAVTQLRLALVQTKEYGKLENWAEIEGVVGQLAGLGGGLTPAGDDYLIGVMAVLWLSGYKNWPPRIAAEAAPRTTTLSAAFLQAAGRGEFIEPWHELAQALVIRTPEAFNQALRRVAQFGASSGVDALAGFAMTLLSLKDINY